MNIGFIADDSKKKLMQNFCIAYRSILNKHQLFATGTSGRMIEEVTSLNVKCFLEGELGGTQQFASQVESNDMDLVFYFCDPQEHAPSHTLRIKKIHQLCDAYSIPLATNLATAELLIRSLESGDLEWREAYHS